MCPCLLKPEVSGRDEGGQILESRKGSWDTRPEVSHTALLSPELVFPSGPIASGVAHSIQGPNQKMGLLALGRPGKGVSAPLEAPGAAHRPCSIQSSLESDTGQCRVALQQNAGAKACPDLFCRAGRGSGLSVTII